MTSKHVVLTIVALLVITVCFVFIHRSSKYSSMQNQETTPINTVTIKDKVFSVEVMDTPALRAQGLSERDPLEPDQGMLFIFDEPGIYPFWMKEMKFSIDILWIHQGEIVDIWVHAPFPDEGERPAHYTPRAPADIVLEVTAGFIDEYEVAIGDIVSLDNIEQN